MPRILLMDGDVERQRALAGVLVMAGYEVRCAQYHEVLRLLQDLQPDLLLMELVMEEGDGFELMRSMESLGWSGKLVFMAGGEASHAEFLLSMTLDLGAHATLKRPFSDERLLECVRRCLSCPGG